MAFQKGQSGNPGGRSKDKPWADALRMEISAAENSPRALRRIAKKVLNLAAAGDMQAVREIGDRLDGKPAQESSVTVTRVNASELSDNELADIATGSGEDTADAPLNPSQLN